MIRESHHGATRLTRGLLVDRQVIVFIDDVYLPDVALPSKVASQRSFIHLAFFALCFFKKKKKLIN